jgi:hypothetical protein
MLRAPCGNLAAEVQRGLRVLTLFLPTPLSFTATHTMLRWAPAVLNSFSCLLKARACRRRLCQRRGRECPVTLRALLIACHLRLSLVSDSRESFAGLFAALMHLRCMAELGLLRNLCAAVLRPRPVAGNASLTAYST